MAPRSVMTVAGSDSGGGAGIQADLKTFTVLGCYGVSVLTSLTAQNTVGVHDILEVAPEFVGAQFDAVASDIQISAIKTGMLPNPEIVRVVAEKISAQPGVPCVVDPVIVATSGDRLVSEAAVSALSELLLPLATVITPNITEAEVLSGTKGESEAKIASVADMRQTAEALSAKFGTSVLIKGGHFAEQAAEQAEITDVLCADGEITEHKAPYIDSKNTHGTGCTLSAAIAANLANGHALSEAVGRAKRYITDAIRHAYPVGKGRGPVNHAYRIKPRD